MVSAYTSSLLVVKCSLKLLLSSRCRRQQAELSQFGERGGNSGAKLTANRNRVPEK